MLSKRAVESRKLTSGWLAGVFEGQGEGSTATEVGAIFEGAEPAAPPAVPAVPTTGTPYKLDRNCRSITTVQPTLDIGRVPTVLESPPNLT